MALKSFDKDNELSTKWSDDADMVYPKIFGDIDHIDFMDFNTAEGKAAQLAGIDKKLYMKDGRLIKIDEKTHRDSSALVIEFWSDINTGKQGWLYTSTADYISQIEPRQDKMLIVSMNTIREYARTHINEFKAQNRMRWQESTRNGRTWKSGHINVSEKELMDWSNKTVGIEKPVIKPLHDYK
jgi:hypothetical protein